MKFKKIGLTIMLSFTTSLLTFGCTNENEISHETVEQVKVDDIKEPIQEKFNQTMALAEKGDAEAQYNLGWMYSNGEGVESDETVTAQWFQKAADQGHIKALYNLGVMYRDGVGVPQDDIKAADYFLKAADQGVADAQYNIGYMYYHGRGVAQDTNIAKEWLKKSADQGFKAAQETLSAM